MDTEKSVEAVVMDQDREEIAASIGQDQQDREMDSGQAMPTAADLVGAEMCGNVWKALGLVLAARFDSQRMLVSEEEAVLLGNTTDVCVKYYLTSVQVTPPVALLAVVLTVFGPKAYAVMMDRKLAAIQKNAEGNRQGEQGGPGGAESQG